MIVVATDAPLGSRNLARLAKRAMPGLCGTGGIEQNGSGDYAIAFSTSPGVRVPYEPKTLLLQMKVVDNDAMSPLFMARIEATEEAIVNSQFRAETTTGRDHHRVEALPVDKVLRLMHARGYPAVQPAAPAAGAPPQIRTHHAPATAGQLTTHSYAL